MRFQQTLCFFGLQMNGTPINSGMGICGLCDPIGVITGWFAPPKRQSPAVRRP